MSLFDYCQFDVRNSFLLCSLNEISERLRQSYVNVLFKIPNRFAKMFFPIFRFEKSFIWMTVNLELKFCCTFMSIQSSFMLESLYTLYNWIDKRYFIISNGNALLWILCNWWNDILRSDLLFKILKAFADADSKCCFSAEFSDCISQISQL